MERGYSKKIIEKRLKEDSDNFHKYRNKFKHLIENSPGQIDQTLERIVELIEQKRNDFKQKLAI